MLFPFLQIIYIPQLNYVHFRQLLFDIIVVNAGDQNQKILFLLQRLRASDWFAVEYGSPFFTVIVDISLNVNDLKNTGSVHGVVTGVKYDNILFRRLVRH